MGDISHSVYSWYFANDKDYFNGQMNNVYLIVFIIYNDSLYRCTVNWDDNSNNRPIQILYFESHITMWLVSVFVFESHSHV